MTDVEEIKKAITEDFVIGSEQTLKSLRSGNAKKVFITSNCALRVRQTIESYAQIAKVDVVNVELQSDELGALCKKPFSISILSVLKGK